MKTLKKYRVYSQNKCAFDPIKKEQKIIFRSNLTKEQALEVAKRCNYSCTSEVFKVDFIL